MAGAVMSTALRQVFLMLYSLLIPFRSSPASRPSVLELQKGLVHRRTKIWPPTIYFPGR